MISQEQLKTVKEILTEKGYPEDTVRVRGTIKDKRDWWVKRAISLKKLDSLNEQQAAELIETLKQMPTKESFEAQERNSAWKAAGTRPHTAGPLAWERGVSPYTYEELFD